MNKMEKGEIGISLNEATKKIIRQYVDNAYVHYYAGQRYREKILSDITDLVERCIYADNHMNDFDLKDKDK